MKEESTLNENEFSNFPNEKLIPNQNQNRNRKILIISIILFIFIAIVITIILAIASDSNTSESSEIAEINCNYNIHSINEEINILGEDFTKNSKFDIYIDGNKIEYTKKYKFEKVKIYNIKYKYYENIEMDYMFKNIYSLISVEMISKNNSKITSMIGSFENCVNLESFKIKEGFDISQIKSISKLFYNTSLNVFNIDNFDINNVEDVSYMFSFSKLEEINLNKLNTKNIKNMSQMYLIAIN